MRKKITVCKTCGAVRETILLNPKYPVGTIFKDKNGIERFNIGFSTIREGRVKKV